MAWTTPRTWVSGETVTAALMNTHIRDNELFLVAREGARATTTATQAIAASTPTTLNNGAGVWTATEDSGGYVSASTTAPIIVPAGRGGLFAIGCNMKTSVAIATRAYCDLMVNGVAGKLRVVFTGDAIGSFSTVVAMAATDYLALQVYLNPAGTASIGIDVFCYRIRD